MSTLVLPYGQLHTGLFKTTEKCVVLELGVMSSDCFFVFACCRLLTCIKGGDYLAHQKSIIETKSYSSFRFSRLHCNDILAC